MSARKIVSQRIEDVRKKRNLSQPAFAEKLGMEGTKGRSTVNNWEQGAIQIKSDDLTRICKTFGVSADYLLGFENEETAEPDMKNAIKVTGLSEKAIINARNLDSIDLLQRLMENCEFCALLDEIAELEGRVYCCKNEYHDIEQKIAVKPQHADQPITLSELNDPAVQEQLGQSVDLSYSIWHFSVEFAHMRLAAQDIEKHFSSILSTITETAEIVEKGKQLLK